MQKPILSERPYMVPNPFTPTFGRIPLLMTGRDAIIEEMEQAFDIGSGDPNLSTIYTGARGTGKTALLLYLSRIASAHGWIAVNVTAIPGMLEDILEQTKQGAAQFLEASDNPRLRSLTIGQFLGLEWDNPTQERGNWRTQMGKIIASLNDQEIGLLITVDEVNPKLDEMVHLATTYQHFVGEERQVGLLLAGLPGNVNSLLRNESVSFIRRANQHKLVRISDEDIAEGIRTTIEEGGRSISLEALSSAAKASEGFPYLMQLVGYQSWARNPDSETVSEEDVHWGIARARASFSERGLDATYYDLSDGDIRFLRAMLADTRESRLSDIASRMGEASNYTSTYKRRLIEQGVIGERGSSYVSFELPGFREYLEDRFK